MTKDLILENIIYQLTKITSSSAKKTFQKKTDSYIKRYEGIRKLTTGYDEDYTTGCLLGYKYIISHYRLIAVDLSWQKN